jgi:hypothetical protein
MGQFPTPHPLHKDFWEQISVLRVYIYLHRGEGQMAFFERIFLAHPRSVGETYGEHMKFAAWFSFQLLRAGSAAAIHSVIPALCETTASRIVKGLTKELAERSGRSQSDRR